MNRTAAIILTVVTAFACGLPAVILMCIGGLALMGTQMPEVMAQNAATPQDVFLGAGIFICFGVVLLAIPILVGIFSFRMSKTEEPAAGNIDYIPPAS